MAARRQLSALVSRQHPQSLYRGSPRQDGSEHIASPKISRSAQPENLSTVSQTVSGEGESGLITIDARLVALYYTCHYSLYACMGV